MQVVLKIVNQPSYYQVKFIRQIKDFYRTKGTEESYKILFRALYGQEVNIIKPSDFLIKPSDADYGFEGFQRFRYWHLVI